MSEKKMRRFRQELPAEQCDEILNAGTSGVLALMGDDGFPYAVPLSYVYSDGKIIFHSAKAGHKIDAIQHCSKASFCVIATDDVQPDTFTTHFRSVIAFGDVRLIEDDEQKVEALKVLSAKYSPGHPGTQAEIDKFLQAVAVIVMDVTRISGKQAIELVRKEKVE